MEEEPRRFIQVLAGPRQVGKTTLVRQLIKQTAMPHIFETADAVPASDNQWLSGLWERARWQLKQEGGKAFLLVIDDIQKVDNWSEQIKREWDQDSGDGQDIRLLVLGSSRLLMQQGLTESLAGRYELSYMGHWSLAEMSEAFGTTPEEYVWFGGYPGAASLTHDEARWKQYIVDSLIESSISKDILMLTRIDKPALMRRLFELGCCYSGQILSYNKIMGQLQGSGNTTTLAHYLSLLDTAGLLAGLEKYNPKKLRQRASSPKYQVHNMALMTAQQSLSFDQVRSSPELWGRWVESAVGTHLVNQAISHRLELYYWRERNQEVDFVLTNQQHAAGLEIKSGGTEAHAHKHMEAFRKEFQPKRVMLIGKDGIPWEDFLRSDVRTLLS